MHGEQGLVSTRGGKMASYMYQQEGLTKERLSLPRMYTGDQWLDTTWAQALALYAGVTKKILDNEGPGGLGFNCFDHGGAGGGFENTWGTGKLMFTALRRPWCASTTDRPTTANAMQRGTWALGS